MRKSFLVPTAFMAMAAEALVDWLAGDPTGSGNLNILILGDLNSYDKEDPIDVIVAGGYTDLIHAFRGEDAYSFVFGGQTGYLDYALSSADLLDDVTGVADWHINADEADLIDYERSFKGPNQEASLCAGSLSFFGSRSRHCWPERL